MIDTEPKHVSSPVHPVSSRQTLRSTLPGIKECKMLSIVRALILRAPAESMGKPGENMLRITGDLFMFARRLLLDEDSVEHLVL